MRRAAALVFAGSLCGALTAGPAPGSTGTLELRPASVVVGGKGKTVRMPAGFVLEVLAEGLRGPRLLTFAENGDLFLGSKGGAVYRLAPPYTRPEVLVELPGYPHSVAFREGELLVAQTDGLYRAPYVPGQKQVRRDQVALLAPLPAGRGHTSRTVRVGPDGEVYLALGISGNCSDQYLDESYPFADRRGGVLVLREGGGAARWETFASGLRNPVGFDWQPGTGVLYASNNGPDHLGFGQPPEYFSRLDPASFHGMPWFQYDGREIRRDPCQDRAPPRPLSDVSTPAATFPARSAPMGVAFVPRGALSPALQGDAVVALHGSWATAPSGGFFGDRATRREPKVVVVRFEGGQPRRVDDLVTGFQEADGGRWARPVGVGFGPDGALYFTSDDGAEALFRLRPARAEEGRP